MNCRTEDKEIHLISGHFHLAERPSAFEQRKKICTFWNNRPCGSWLADDAVPGSGDFFERTENARYQREPFIGRIVNFPLWEGKSVLEVGCGTGVDLSMFARHGARVVGIDLTTNGASLAAERLRHCGLKGTTLVADCERLPFPDSEFDLVYSWGVIHHTPDTEAAATEIMRVTKPGGRVIAMIYNRRSLVALQAYLLYGVLRGHPRRRLADIIAAHLESPGTKAFTQQEARNLFAPLEDLAVNSIVTVYDLRVGRDRFLPAWTASLVPRHFGYFIIIKGRKTSPLPA
jgi:ubiquinone/menaquinone biosynthesis C-methylase UbiE